MKKSLMMFVCAVLLAGTAHAQGVVASGIYVGGGISFDAFKVEDLSFGEGPASVNGVDISGFGGYKFRRGRISFGPEVVVSSSFASGEDNDYLLPASIGLSFDVRGRVGFDAGRAEPYAAIGLSMTGYKADHEGDDDPDDIASDRLRVVIFAFGVDFNIDARSFVRAELGFQTAGTGVFPFYGNSDPHEFRAKGMRFVFAYGRVF